MTRHRHLALLVAVLATVVLVSSCGQQTIEAAGDDDDRPAATAEEWGPAAVVDGVVDGADGGASTDEGLVAGILEVDDDCVLLDERGHSRILLAWPGDAVRWSPDDRSLTFTADTPTQLHDQDRVTLTGTVVADATALTWAAEPSPSCSYDAIWHVADVVEWLAPPSGGGAVDGPIGGGLASGTGVEVDLVCPDGVEERTEEWVGPVGLTRYGAVAEVFGDLIVGWIGEPLEIESTDSWSSWGLEDEAGNLVAVATVVAVNGAWDPSHARYCAIAQPAATPPPFTLHVSNQSFEDPTVGIVVTIDDTIVVDQDFDVEGQHNWITFDLELGEGVHTLTAVSSTGAELTTEFTIPEGEPRWAVLDYWFYPGEGPREFSFNVSDEPIGFG